MSTEEKEMLVLVEDTPAENPAPEQNEIDEKRKALNELNASEVSVTPLPSSSALKQKMEENLARFTALSEEMSRLEIQAMATRENIVRFGNFTKNAKEMFHLAQLAVNIRDYAEAKNRYEEIKDYASYDFGIALSSQALMIHAAEFGLLLSQTKLWNQCLTAGESVDELDVEAAVNRLLCIDRGLYSPEEINPLLDELKGVWALALYRANAEEKPSLGAFVSFTEDLDKLDAIELPPSEKTDFRMGNLRDLYRHFFNRLCALYTDESRDFESALAVFHHKSRIPASLISHPLYVEAENDEDFRVKFEARHLDAMPDEEFAASFPNVLVGVGPDLAPSIFAAILKKPDLEPGKLLAASSYFDTLTFERKTQLLARLFDQGVPEERLHLITGKYLQSRKVEGDLDILAPDLLRLENLLQGEEAASFVEIKKALLRSPKAHRAIRKSSSLDTHALRGKKEGEFKPFVGKKLGNPTVHAWGKTVHGLYLGAILTLATLSVAALVGGFLSIQYLISPLLLAAPMAGAFIAAFWAIASYTGRDERPARLFRILFGLGMFLLAGASLAVYLFPVELAAYLPYTHPCFLASGVLGLACFFLIFDKRQVWNYLVYLPLLLVWITALVFFILGLMQNSIVL